MNTIYPKLNLDLGKVVLPLKMSKGTERYGKGAKKVLKGTEKVRKLYGKGTEKVRKRYGSHLLSRKKKSE